MKTVIVSEHRGCTTLLIPITAGTLRIPLANGLGRLVQQKAKLRATRLAEAEVESLARAADAGQMPAAILGNPEPALSQEDARSVANVLRRTAEYFRTYGLPPAGRRVALPAPVPPVEPQTPAE